MLDKLDAAFRRTRYHVLLPVGELVLRVDQAEPALASLLRETGVSAAALLTAFNPGGRRQPAFRNRLVQQRLGRELTGNGHTVFAGRNEDPRGRWPKEPTLLALGLSLNQAQETAAHYQQSAFLWLEGNGTPRLIYVTGPTWRNR